jgi:NAD(P) transhydrogenase subunit alpha
MSGSNAISGIILVGTIVVAGRAETGPGVALALIGVALAAVNLVGGFVVTDRMLRLFRRPAGRDRKPRS